MSHTPAASEPAAIAAALGRIPSGLFIITVKAEDGRSTGFLASWVQQASFSPPLVTFAVNQSRYLNDWLTPAAAVAINQIGEHQKSLLKHFAAGFEPTEPAFEGLSRFDGVTGAVILSMCPGALEGRIAGRVEAGDHRVYLLEILSAYVNPHAKEAPWVHVRKNGLNY